MSHLKDLMSRLKDLVSHLETSCPIYTCYHTCKLLELTSSGPSPARIMGKVPLVLGAIFHQVEKEGVEDSKTNVLREGSGPTFQGAWGAVWAAADSSDVEDEAQMGGVQPASPWRLQTGRHSLGKRPGAGVLAPERDPGSLPPPARQAGNGPTVDALLITTGH